MRKKSQAGGFEVGRAVLVLALPLRDPFPFGP